MITWLAELATRGSFPGVKAKWTPWSLSIYGLRRRRFSNLRLRRRLKLESMMRNPVTHWNGPRKNQLPPNRTAAHLAGLIAFPVRNDPLSHVIILPPSLVHLPFFFFSFPLFLWNQVFLLPKLRSDFAKFRNKMAKWVKNSLRYTNGACWVLGTGPGEIFVSSTRAVL